MMNWHRNYLCVETYPFEFAVILLVVVFQQLAYLAYLMKGPVDALALFSALATFPESLLCFVWLLLALK